VVESDPSSIMLHLGASRHCYVLPLPGSSQCPFSVALCLGAKSVAPLRSGGQRRPDSTRNPFSILLIPEFCPSGPRLSCGPTLSTNQMRPWD